MSKAAISVFVFALYLFLIGSVLVVAPNLLLSLFLIPETTEVWVRVVGMLVLILGYYYYVAARRELIPFIRASVYGRLSVLFFFVIFFLLGLAPPMLVVFGVVDALAAAWTATARRIRLAPPSVAKASRREKAARLVTARGRLFRRDEGSCLGRSFRRISSPIPSASSIGPNFRHERTFLGIVPCSHL